MKSISRRTRWSRAFGRTLTKRARPKGFGACSFFWEGVAQRGNMPPFVSTVVGSYPRNTSVEDTMKKPSLTRPEIDELIKWATRDQAGLGLDVITDGEGYRENMYYFYQKRLDGITFQGMGKQSLGTP